MQKKCFVIIPFADDFEEVFQHAILSAAQEKGYACERLKEVSGPINIINEIVSNIYEADLIVADLSRLNPNVFYELGLAHAGPISTKTIMIAEHNEQIPFDVSVFQVLKYDRGYEGIVNLRKGIVRQIDFVESQPHLATNPVRDYLLKKEFFGKHPVPAKPPARDDKALLDELQQAQLRLNVLFKLAEPATQSKGMTISELYQTLEVRKRKMLVEMLNDFFEQGILEKTKEKKGLKWQLNERGLKLVQKLGRRHS